jgi:hypothetical protein
MSTKLPTGLHAALRRGRRPAPGGGGSQ